jgi:hypothetical protein
VETSERKLGLRACTFRDVGRMVNRFCDEQGRCEFFSRAFETPHLSDEGLASDICMLKKSIWPYHPHGLCC